jgi:hypothetical protein
MKSRGKIPHNKCGLVFSDFSLNLLLLLQVYPVGVHGSCRSGRKHVRARRHVDILAFIAAVDLRVTSNLWVRHCAASHRRMTFEDGTWLDHDLTASTSLRNSTAGALAYPVPACGGVLREKRQTRLRRTRIAEVRSPITPLTSRHSPSGYA